MTDLTPRRDVPDVTVGRLADYLRALEAMQREGITSVSSHDLSEAVGVGAAQLRKDLSHLGSYGVRGVGYEVQPLAATIAKELGRTQDWPLVIVGMGHLGRALAAYSGLAGAGFPVRALCDNDPALVGSRIGQFTVTTLADLADPAPRVGVIATPASAAQTVADELVARGVVSILNFAPVALTVPEGVDVRTVDVARELFILAFHQQHREPLPERASS